MVITFPILISETVDKEMLPYLIKAIERKFALDYVPLLEQHIHDLLDKGSAYVKKVTSNFDAQPKLTLIADENREFLSESDSYGTQVIPGESNKLMSDQPYTVTIRVTTIGRVTKDFTFGFKGLSIITKDAEKVFENNLDQNRYWVYREARKLLSDKTVWNLISFYRKLFGSKKDERLIYTEKILFSENTERICVLSANDLNRENFEFGNKNYEALTVGNLKRSQFSSLYLDDSLNKRIYMWDQSKLNLSSIITYDMLYKSSLNVLPEQVDKAKQRNTSLFSKKAPTSFAIQKIMGSKKGK